jgi:membrane-associated phospholipid phosphatase
MSFLQKLDYYDKKISNKIHSLELNIFLEIPVYICARLFNPDLISSYLIFILFYKYSFHDDFFFVFKVLIHVLFLLIVTLLMKKLTGRPRPDKKKLYRIKDLRENEKNCSMPSGDSLQCANFCVILLVYFNSPLFFYLLPCVMFARIYYFCHYIMDTLVGGLMGLILSYLIYLGIN